GRHGHDQSTRPYLEVQRRCRSPRALGVGIRQQGFRRRLRREIPSAGLFPGSQAPDGGPVGTASLTGSHDVLLLVPLVIFAAYLVFGITGFGASPITIPVLVHLLPLAFVLPLAALLDLGSALALGV